ncbi:methyltransferase [Kibdelosporangium persicum]|uniref:Hydroxyneurosporene-O-methyltransferase n=1 Tax=Kibdelosporangium persicum TaxID=2698649 RepID=A0ABX2FD12_9PSEU|nr:methyltransferase [Kibdelosporangium persicum]NRN68761.1 Hydroxyneurosporene-O-methyltransferase [Kibdelosporangium persicum]
MNSVRDAATADTNAAPTTVVLAGRVFVPPGDLETFIAEARTVYPVAAANPGNVLMSFSVEDAAAGIVTVLEKWTSQEALDRHVATPVVTALLTKWGPRIRNEVQRFDVLDPSGPGGQEQPGGALPPAMQMIQLLGGFQLAQALYVMAKLDIATRLDDGPRTVADLAAASGAQPEPLGRLIRSLATVGVFRHLPDGTVETTPLGATLSANRPDSARAAALYWMETHYLPFSDLLHNVRTGETAANHYYGEPFFDWIVKKPELVELQTSTMANVTGGLRAGMFDDYRLPAGAVVADIGGANGSVLVRFLAKEPDRRGIVFDLPEVVPGARRHIEEQGLADRVDVVAGDFFESVPPADVYVLAYVLHDWDDEKCRRILGSIEAAAKPGARLVIVEGLVPAGDEPHLTKMIDLIMLAMGGGKERSADEFEQLLSSAGFTLDRIVPTPTPFSFIEATVRP